jgi:D-amino peptidase
MKIYIICDMEGVTGVVNFDQQAKPGSAHYEEARQFLASDLNSAIEGALEGGATEFLIFDTHCFGLNVRLEDLPPNAKVICGKPCLVPPENGLDRSYSALFMVGLHSMAGTPGGLISHSFSEDIENIHLDGIEIGEIGMEAALAGELDVPVAFISGDSKGIEEARALLGEREYAVVKESLSDCSAVCLPPSVTAGLIKSKAKNAVEQIDRWQPFKINPPIELKIKYRKKEGIPSDSHIERVNECTIVLRGESLIELWKKVKPK